MAADYRIREVRVDLGSGVVVIAEVVSIEGIGALVEDLRSKGLEPTGFDEDISRKTEAKKQPTGKIPKAGSDEDSPAGLVEVRVGLAAGSLLSAKVLAFKDGVPQLLRPSTFPTVSDATIALIYALEIGVRNTKIAYEDFEAVFDAQNIKTGTPLPMLLSNLKNAGYVDKAAYGSNRTVRLTAKGEQKAEQVLKSACAGKAGAS